MQIAARIRRVRLEHCLSLGDLAVRAGLSKSLLASFEDGQAVPSMEMFENLADAVGVPLESFFYGDMDSKLTPWLTRRLTVQQLVDEPPRSTSAMMASLLNPQAFFAATKELLSFVTNGVRGLKGENPNPTIPSSDGQAQASADPSDDEIDSEPN